MKTQYWPLPVTGQDRGYTLEIRSHMAWALINHFGSVAAIDDGEDSSNRAKIKLQSPVQLVARCFDIADAFVEAAESRGELRTSGLNEEQAYYRVGELLKIKSRAEYPMDDMPKPAFTQEELDMRNRHRTERAELQEKLRKQETEKPKA